MTPINAAIVAEKRQHVKFIFETEI